jgi:hypothetical protein
VYFFIREGMLSKTGELLLFSISDHISLDSSLKMKEQTISMLQ